MTRAQIEIDIPDDCEISEGPVFSSALWNDDIRKRPHTGVIHFHVVVERKWQWPAWLTAAAVAMESSGSWCAYERPPTIREATWGDGGRWFLIPTGLIGFTPPPCTDWRQSLRLNPNREVKS